MIVFRFQKDRVSNERGRRSRADCWTFASFDGGSPVAVESGTRTALAGRVGFIPIGIGRERGVQYGSIYVTAVRCRPDRDTPRRRLTFSIVVHNRRGPVGRRNRRVPHVTPAGRIDRTRGTSIIRKRFIINSISAVGAKRVSPSM